MVRTARSAAAWLVALLALAGCDILAITPFPGFTDKTDVSVDLGSRVDGIGHGKDGLTYDLNLVTASGQQPRVLLLVEPPSGDGNGFRYTGQEIFMDQDLHVLGQAALGSTLDYFSKPYTYTHDGTILVGYSLFTAQGQAASPTLSATGLEGFGFTDGTRTYVFSTPSGAYTAFDLSWLEYDTGWGILASGTLGVIPDGARPSSTDANYANLGYQLVGLAYNSSTTEITFVLSRPSTGEIVAQRVTLATALTGGAVLAASNGDWPFSVEADRPSLNADTQGLFLVRRDGWAERYPWTETGTLAGTGSRTRVVGDRSLTRRYAFLVSSTAGGPQYMYRFDPASRILTRYRRWW